MDFQVDLPIPLEDFSVYFKSPAGKQLTFSLSGTLPAGLALDPNTGVLSGTPTEVGRFGDIKIVVTDTDQKRITSNAFSINVFGKVEELITFRATNDIFTDQRVICFHTKTYD